MQKLTSIQYLFIINPVSGTVRKQNIPGLIADTLKVSPDKISILHTRYAGHARELAAEAAANGVPRVISVGGDGTMNEIASALLHTETSIGIIPMGSGNGLARHLHIPMDARKAIDMLNHASARVIDSGRINNRPFFCTAGIGLDAEVGHAFDALPDRGLKTYVRAAWKKINEYKGEELNISIEGQGLKELSGTYLITTFANANQYGNNAYIAPKASLDDKMLNLVLMKPVTLWQAFPKIYKLFKKGLMKDMHTTQLLFHSATIHRKKEGPAHVDGEPIMLGKDIIVESVPASLRVLVPTIF